MFIDGTLRILYIDAGDGFFPIGCLTGHDFSEESETISTTTRDNEGWATSKATTQSYSISFSGLVLENDIVSDKITYYDLKIIKREKTLIDWKIDDTEYGQGIITSLSDSNNIDEYVSFDAELIGYGIPLITLDVVYDDYVARAVADGGTDTSDTCLRQYIDLIT